MKDRVLITGSAGYIGRFLTRRLQASGAFEVYGFNRRPDPQLSPTYNLQGDILESDWAALLAEIRPRQIFHLIGTPPASPFSNQLLVNVEGTRRLLQGLVDTGQTVQVVIAGSAAEYGLRDEAVDEMASCHPEAEYGIAKLAQTEIARTFIQRHNLPVTIARIFNVYGETERHLAVASMAYQIARAETIAPEEAAELHVHNLRSWRDFIHVDDVVEALLALSVSASNPETGQSRYDGQIYNVASGNSVPISRIMDGLLSETRLNASELKQVGLRVHGDQREGMSLADISKITRQTGWKPTVSLQDGLRRELAYWRKQIAQTRQGEPVPV